MGFLDGASVGFHQIFPIGIIIALRLAQSDRSDTFADSVGNGDFADGAFTFSRVPIRPVERSGCFRSR